jgi:hypothetical protein
MVTCYIVSNEEFSGKSTICAGLGLILKDQGYNINFIKPVGTHPKRVKDTIIDGDAEFMCEVLGACEVLEYYSPVILTPELYMKVLKEEIPNFMKEIVEVHKKAVGDVDLILMEGARTINDGLALGVSVPQICKKISPRIILVAKYRWGMVDEILYIKQQLEDYFLGVIINMIPRDEIEYIEENLIPYLNKKDIPVFGTVIENKLLSSISVRDLAMNLNGQVLCAHDDVDELVEAFMVGAMGQEKALRFFRRVANKAVITGGDRADIQLAALETSTKCLILTGGFQPSAIVLGRAEELGVPMVLVPYDTLTTVEKTEKIVGHLRIHEAQKVARLKEILTEQVTIDEIKKSIGI